MLPWFNQNNNFSPWLFLMLVVTIFALIISYYLNKKEDKEGYKVMEEVILNFLASK